MYYVTKRTATGLNATTVPWELVQANALCLQPLFEVSLCNTETRCRSQMQCVLNEVQETCMEFWCELALRAESERNGALYDTAQQC